MKKNIQDVLCITFLSLAISFIIWSKSHDIDLLISSIFYFVLTAYISSRFYRAYGLVSWRLGIPVYYLFFFLVIPLVINNDLIESSNWGLSLSSVSKALWCASIGIIGFAIGVRYFTSRKQLKFSIIKSQFRFIDNIVCIKILILVGGASQVLSLFFGFTSIASDVDQSVSALSSIISGANFFLTVGAMAAWSQYFISNDKKYYHYAVIGLVLMEFFAFFWSSKGAILTPVLLIAVLKFTVNPRESLNYIASLFFLYIFIAYPLVTSFRYLNQQAFANDSNSVGAATLFNFIVSGEWLNFESAYGASSSTAVESFGRGLLLYFSKIVQDAGSSVGLLFGDTYLYAIQTFIPRIIMPNKPNLSMGNLLAQYYGLLQIDDDKTGLSPTMMGEFFVNFGIIGIFIGMIFLGYLAVRIDQQINLKRTSWFTAIMILNISWQEALIGQSALPFFKNMIFFTH